MEMKNEKWKIQRNRIWGRSPNLSLFESSSLLTIPRDLAGQCTDEFEGTSRGKWRPFRPPPPEYRIQESEEDLNSIELAGGQGAARRKSGMGGPRAEGPSPYTHRNTEYRIQNTEYRRRPKSAQKLDLRYGGFAANSDRCERVKGSCSGRKSRGQRSEVRGSGKSKPVVAVEMKIATPQDVSYISC